MRTLCLEVNSCMSEGLHQSKMLVLLETCLSGQPIP